MPCPGSIQLRLAALEHAPNGGHFRRGHAPPRSPYPRAYAAGLDFEDVVDSSLELVRLAEVGGLE